MSETMRRSTAVPGRTAAALLALAALCLPGTASIAAAADATTSVPAHSHQGHATGAKPAAQTAQRSTAAAAARQPGKSAPATAYTGDRAETERFLAYDKSIQLTAAQEAIRVEALTPIPAPCCKEFSAATCCCRCNMMRARDGLAKHLIANLGADPVKVRTSVTAWHEAINPDGFSGDSCSTGGCGKSFQDNGCGGMTDGQLVH